MFGFKKRDYKKEIKDVVLMYASETMPLEPLYKIMDTELDNFTNKELNKYFSTHDTTVEKWSLALITDSAIDVIGSGSLHEHRGLLTAEGREYFTMVHGLLNRQLELGLISQEDKDTLLDNLDEKVRFAG